MKRQLIHWRGLMLSLMVFAAFATLSSCGSDEPKSEVIDYYLNMRNSLLTAQRVIPTATTIPSLA